MVRPTFYFRFAANWKLALLLDIASQFLKRRPSASIIILGLNSRRYLLKQDGHLCPAVSLLKCDRHAHLSCDGGIRRVKGDRLDNPCRGRKFYEPCRETVFPLRGFAAVHLLG